MKTKYDTLSKVKGIACPKLILHGRKDDMIPFEMGERLFAAAAEPKESAWFDEGGHNGLIDLNWSAWRSALRRFVERVAP
jgi:fermentation-respiration switch protein FrsA (DUF1100 family)